MLIETAIEQLNQMVSKLYQENNILIDVNNRLSEKLSFINTYLTDEQKWKFQRDYESFLIDMKNEKAN
jgi:hypothetical protein